ncbi:MAG TPA: hypothetical protein VFQ65_13005 [Kofleriaceae bacterium]|nr:hypothetical protein [Kofleriaceae bacterium]
MRTEMVIDMPDKDDKDNTDKNVEILDAIYEEAALDAAEHGTNPPADRSWAREVGKRVQARLAELRRNLVPATAPVVQAQPIRPSLLALGRDALIAKLDELTRRLGSSVQYAHRNLEGLSDDDLRRLIDTLDPDPG